MSRDQRRSGFLQVTVKAGVIPTIITPALTVLGVTDVSYPEDEIQEQELELELELGLEMEQELGLELGL